MASNSPSTMGFRRRIPTEVFFDSLPPLPRTCGVYAIINRDNLKVYIGSGRIVNKRLNCHLSEFRSGRHSNPHLLRSFRSNPRAFEFTMVEEVRDLDKLLEREQFWINFYQSTNPEKGYNLCKSAKSSGLIAPHLEEVKNQFLSVRKKRTWPQAQREYFSKLFKGRKQSPEAIAKKVATCKLRKVKCVPIIQMDENGNPIKRFNSLTEAAISVNGNISNISRVVRRVRGNVRYRGFGWKYA